jgi:predicted nucleotidyltransferase component of viral defense system
LENRTAARDLYDVHFLAKRYSSDFSTQSRVRLREFTSDINQMEGRFRPAFEEDDLFREHADLVPVLLLELSAALA